MTDPTDRSPQHERAALPADRADRRVEQLAELGETLLLDRSAHRPESLEKAVATFRRALDECPPEASEALRVRLLRDLADALRNRLGGPRAEDLEEAIALYREAIGRVDREAAPEDWARLQGSLGMALGDRIRGDRSENREAGIAAYRKALEVFTRDRFPVEWAVTVHNLANALRDLVRGDREQNLEEAIRLYRASLEVRTREANPVQWAMTLHNLAIAYRRRIRGDGEENVERALDLCRRALEVRTRESAPLRWAQTQCTLGNAWGVRRRGDRAVNLRRACEAFESALEMITPETSPFEAAVVLRNLGKARAAFSMECGEEDIGPAIAACEAALVIHRLDTAPFEHRETSDVLGLICFARERWSEAAEALASAVAASERLYRAGATPESHGIELREARGRSARLAYALARTGRPAEAVEVLERSRVRALGEALDLDEPLLGDAREEHRRAFREVRETIRSLEMEARGPAALPADRFLALAGELRAARDRLGVLVREVRSYLPEFFPEGLRLAEIGRLASTLECPLVELLTVSCGSLALVVPPGAAASGDVAAVWLDRFDESVLEHLLFRRPHPLVAAREDPARLRRALDEIRPVLRRLLLEPLADLLEAHGFDRAVLLPADRLPLLPLHAAIEDRVLLTTAPSARLLRASLARAHSGGRAPALLGVAASPAGSPLPFARSEVERAAARFPSGASRLLVGSAATPAAVLAGMPGATHLHFACHGRFDEHEPIESALVLAAGEGLTLRGLLENRPDLSAARLAVLSACRTGLSDYLDLPDEALGFPAVLLVAGVPAVVGTLWPVADPSAALLTARFWKLHRIEGRPPAEALRSAQRWLREATAAELGVHAEILLDRASTAAERAAAYRLLRRLRAQPGLRPYAHFYHWAGYFLAGDPGRSADAVA